MNNVPILVPETRAKFDTQYLVMEIKQFSAQLPKHFSVSGLHHRERRTEAKTDSYSKDRMFFVVFIFCVITLEPIEVQTCSAPQNDRLNLCFVKDIKVLANKMA